MADLSVTRRNGYRSKHQREENELQPGSEFPHLDSGVRDGTGTQLSLFMLIDILLAAIDISMDRRASKMETRLNSWRMGQSEGSFAVGSRETYQTDHLLCFLLQP